MAHTRWTEYETVKARELLATEIGEREFQRLTGRTKAAAFARIKYLDNPGFRDRCIDNASRNRKRYEKRVYDPSTPHYVESGPHVPGHLLIDAERRLMAPRTITAMLCGDPAPGFSALEKRDPCRKPTVHLAESAGDWA
jgi:hypothetical protein